MLCELCVALFAFSQPHVMRNVLKTKKVAVEEAKKGTLVQQASLQRLQRDVARYQSGVEARTASADVPAPCPFDLIDSYTYSWSQVGNCTVWGSHHAAPTLRRLEESAESVDCQMCKAIVAMTYYATGTEAMVNLTFETHLFNGWLRVDVKQDESRVAMLGFHLSIEGVASDSSIPVRTPITASTDSESCSEFILQALTRCLIDHGLCRDVELAPWLPTRLLDLRPELPSEDAIRLIQTEDIPEDSRLNAVHYLTLSHTWGQVCPTRLKLSNMKEMETEIRFEILPRRFQDTIVVARRLGIRFLWIDSMCIIQDSPTDWAKESSMMDQVYRHGICNISACDGVDSTAGLFSIRDPQAGEPIRFTQLFSDCSIRFTVLADYVDLIRRHSTLYSRGWVLQERLLSPRIIHFSHFLTWECRTCLSSETYDGAILKPARFGFPNFPVSERHWTSANNQRDPRPVARWWDLVKIYTRMKLTYQKDKLVAIAGLAQQFSDVIKEPYYAGIWGGTDLILSLLWVCWPLPSVQIYSEPEYRAPSWSWASAEGEIYHNLLLGLNTRLRRLAQLRSISIKPAQGKAFGQVEGGELSLKAFLLELPTPYQTEEGLKTAARLDYRNATALDSIIYFVPFIVIDPEQHPSKVSRQFLGIFVQRDPEFEDSGLENAPFRRVGYGSFVETLHRKFLKPGSWEELCSLSHPELYGQDLIIV